MPITNKAQIPTVLHFENLMQLTQRHSLSGTCLHLWVFKPKWGQCHMPSKHVAISSDLTQLLQSHRGLYTTGFTVLLIPKTWVISKWEISRNLLYYTEFYYVKYVFLFVCFYIFTEKETHIKKVLSYFHKRKKYLLKLKYKYMLYCKKVLHWGTNLSGYHTDCILSKCFKHCWTWCCW